jgi:chromosome partitioning protein
LLSNTYVISIANNKGGTGKTTTAINLAAALVEGGEAVLLVDADDQSSTASDWRKVRPDRTPVFQMVALRSPTIHAELPALLAKSRFTIVVIDCPPGGPSAGGKMTRSALLVSDLVIIPAAPSGPDFWASDPMAQMLQELQMMRPDPLVSRLLINRKSPNTRLGREARTAAAAMLDIPLFKTEVCQRTSVAESITRGMTIFEFNQGGLAALEYRDLAEETIACLRQPPAARSEDPSETSTPKLS